MVCWVVERSLAARKIGRAIVATDDSRVFDAVRQAGHEAVMTSKSHASGTDRLAEVASSLDDADIIVNVQGDEPLISPETIDRAIEALVEEQAIEQSSNQFASKNIDHDHRSTSSMVTTSEPIESGTEVLNPDVVKVVTDHDGYALYFSRLPIPYLRDAARRHCSIVAALDNEPELLKCFRKHTGLYVYRREFLLAYARWPQSVLERAESLEQLRALEHGVRIKVIEASTPSIGVDTQEDLERARSIMEQNV